MSRSLTTKLSSLPPDYRNQGIGLIAQIVDLAEADGVTVLTCHRKGSAPVLR